MNTPLSVTRARPRSSDGRPEVELGTFGSQSWIWPICEGESWKAPSVTCRALWLVDERGIEVGLLCPDGCWNELESITWLAHPCS